MKLDKSHINQVERNIAPPMPLAITLPIDEIGVIVYVAAGAFSSKRPTTSQLKEVAQKLTLGFDPEERTITTSEVYERIAKAIREMEGKDIAELCNREFGMNIQYLEDDVFEVKN